MYESNDWAGLASKCIYGGIDLSRVEQIRSNADTENLMETLASAVLGNGHGWDR